jgi:hypothetical protein
MSAVGLCSAVPKSVFWGPRTWRFLPSRQGLLTAPLPSRESDRCPGAAWKVPSERRHGCLLSVPSESSDTGVNSSLRLCGERGYVGVSGSPNQGYGPTTGGSGVPGSASENGVRSEAPPTSGSASWPASSPSAYSSDLTARRRSGQRRPRTGHLSRWPLLGQRRRRWPGASVAAPLTGAKGFRKPLMFAPLGSSASPTNRPLSLGNAPGLRRLRAGVGVQRFLFRDERRPWRCP